MQKKDTLSANDDAQGGNDDNLVRYDDTLVQKNDTLSANDDAQGGNEDNQAR